MNTYIYLWQYRAEFLLELGLFQTKVVEKIKTYKLYDQEKIFRNSYCFLDNVEKYDTSIPTTDFKIIRRMRFACWITLQTNTQNM